VFTSIAPPPPPPPLLLPPPPSCRRAIDAVLVGLALVGLGEWADIYHDPLSSTLDPDRPAAAFVALWSALPMLLAVCLILLRSAARRWVFASLIAPDAAAYRAAWAAVAADPAQRAGLDRAAAAAAVLAPPPGAAPPRQRLESSRAGAMRGGLAAGSSGRMDGPWAGLGGRAAGDSQLGAARSAGTWEPARESSASVEQLFGQAAVVQASFLGISSFALWSRRSCLWLCYSSTRSRHTSRTHIHAPRFPFMGMPLRMRIALK
jgi:hypothetical protein